MDNSRNNHYCGVNDEVRILSKTGCYADFTFPCFNKATPSQINSIYYAKDDIYKPKSHDTGIEVTRGRPKQGDLMIIQGPMHAQFIN